MTAGKTGLIGKAGFCIIFVMEIPDRENDGVRILVIDDEQVIRELLFDVLSRKGYAVDTAEDGERGLEKASQTEYDIVFTDLRMPGMNGLDVFKHLKEKWPRTRVIVMTGFGLQEMINEALSLGAFADVKKPFDLSLIYELVDKALRCAAP
ncbi:MAG: hypothetical protein Kow0099_39380 [Candidatus Abyssubacteria bacterium]